MNIRVLAAAAALLMLAGCSNSGSNVLQQWSGKGDPVTLAKCAQPKLSASVAAENQNALFAQAYGLGTNPVPAMQSIALKSGCVSLTANAPYVIRVKVDPKTDSTNNMISVGAAFLTFGASTLASAAGNDKYVDATVTLVDARTGISRVSVTGHGGANDLTQYGVIASAPLPAGTGPVSDGGYADNDIGKMATIAMARAFDKLVAGLPAK